jgi:chloramphenicol-sensitive protein RarD
VAAFVCFARVRAKPKISKEELMQHNPRGPLLTLCAYFIWGFTAVFFSLLAHMSPWEIIAHRALWSLPLALAVLWFSGEVVGAIPALHRKQVLLILVVTSLIVASNWGLYVWAVINSHALEASLGYFINPLISVMLGFFLLKETINSGQWLAIGIAGVGVLVQTVMLGYFPWIAVVLATTFAFYGYLRKTVDVLPIVGFFIETLLLAPFALLAIIVMQSHGASHFLGSFEDTALLLACGVISAVPLMLFAKGIKITPLVIVGMTQYITPSILFLSAVFILDEPLRQGEFLSFVLIWLALIIFTISSFRVKGNK